LGIGSARRSGGGSGEVLEDLESDAMSYRSQKPGNYSRATVSVVMYRVYIVWN
jgi:hypothetical protein